MLPIFLKAAMGARALGKRASASLAACAFNLKDFFAALARAAPTRVLTGISTGLLLKRELFDVC